MYEFVQCCYVHLIIVMVNTSFGLRCDVETISVDYDSLNVMFVSLNNLYTKKKFTGSIGGIFLLKEQNEWVLKSSPSCETVCLLLL